MAAFFGSERRPMESFAFFADYKTVLKNRIYGSARRADGSREKRAGSAKQSAVAHIVKICITGYANLHRNAQGRSMIGPTTHRQ